MSNRLFYRAVPVSANDSNAAPPANCRQLHIATENGCIAFQKRNVSVGFNLCADHWVIGWGYAADFNCNKKIVIFGTGENIDPEQHHLHFDDVEIGSRLTVFLLTVRKQCAAVAHVAHHRRGTAFEDTSTVYESRGGTCVDEPVPCKEKYTVWRVVIAPPLHCSHTVEFLHVSSVKVNSIVQGLTEHGRPVAAYNGVRDLLYPHLIH